MTACPDFPNDTVADYNRFEGSRLSRVCVPVKFNVCFLSKCILADLLWPPVPCSCDYCLRYFLLLWQNTVPKRPSSGEAKIGTEGTLFTDLLSIACSNYNFIPPRATYLSWSGTVSNGLGLEHQSFIKTMPHRLTYRLFRWGHFPSWVSFSWMTLGCV